MWKQRRIFPTLLPFAQNAIPPWSVDDCPTQPEIPRRPGDVDCDYEVMPAYHQFQWPDIGIWRSLWIFATQCPVQCGLPSAWPARRRKPPTGWARPVLHVAFCPENPKRDQKPSQAQFFGSHKPTFLALYKCDWKFKEKGWSCVGWFREKYAAQRWDEFQQLIDWLLAWNATWFQMK